MSETKKKQKKSPKTKTKKEPKPKVPKPKVAKPKVAKEPKTKTKKEPKPKVPKEPKTKKAKEPKEKKAVTKRGPRKPIIILSSSPPFEKVMRSEEPKPLSQMTTLSDPPFEKVMRSEEPKPLSQMTTLSEKIQLSPLSQSLAPPFPKVDLAPPFLKVDNDLKITPENTITMPKRYNEEFIDIMEQLSAIMTKQGEPFRARAYQKAQEAIMTYPGDITSPEDLKGRPNIGATIMEKLKEYVETGTLRILEREKTNPVNILGEIYGVGPKKAKELVDKGITSIAQLRENQQMLNDVQKVGLQYYEDVLKRIPRQEIDEYRDIIYAAAKPLLTSEGALEIVGSYRRGAQNSGDIDIIITSPSEKPFIQIIDELMKQGIIVAVLSRGPSKCLVMAKIPSSQTIRRVDFLYTTPEEYPFAVLYFTGSKIFNTIMRQHALNMGLTMNEHGLYKMEGKTKGEKVAHTFKTEKDIFDYLQLPYVLPEQRIDGRQLNPPLKKVEPNPHPPLGKVMQSEEPNPTNTSKISGDFAEPKLQIITQFVEEPLGPKVPKVTKAKTLKAKKEKVDKKDFAPKVGKKKIIIEEEDLALSSAKPFPKVDLALSSAKPFLKVDKVDLALPFSKADLDALTEEELTAVLNYANIMYRNFQPIMTDNEYDIIEDYIKEKYPNNQALSQIGATPVTKNKVTLPYFMGSMDKIKPDTNALQTWKAKYTGPYVLSCKLDGVSGLYTTEESKPKLYTRGDGKVGQDISYLIPYLRLPKNKGLVIRGEFIISKAAFNTKYKATFANARNMVSGIVNQKSVNPEIIKDVDFVSYELIKPLKKPSEQFAALQKLDINVVLFKKVEQTELTNDLLSETLIDWRDTYPYEIDGVIVTNDEIYPTRKAGNPEHSFAFKMVLSDQIAEAKVVDVIWTPSKDGYLKPRVQIEPINLGGVKIEYATGFNGQFIYDNKVGIGALIELIRSGDVIPHIRKVVVPATQAKMPSVAYKWNDTHVDVLLEDIESDEIVKEKNITGFFRGIEVEGLSSGNIKRMIEAGFDSVPKILQMKPQDFLQVEGFKEKTAQKLYTNIQSQIQSAPLVKIMAASNIFGRGFSDKKLELILEAYPNILQEQQHVNKVAKVAAIKGMAAKTAEAFVEKIPAFLAFLHEANLEGKLQQQAQQPSQSKDQSHPLYNKSIVFTGFRDKQLEETLKTLGAKIGSSVSKNTFVVITKDPLDETGKVLEAKKHNIPIMTPEEFIQIHL